MRFSELLETSEKVTKTEVKKEPKKRVEIEEKIEPGMIFSKVEKEMWEERAGIMEYTGDFTREQAEAGACEEILGARVYSGAWEQAIINELSGIEIKNENAIERLSAGYSSQGIRHYYQA